MYFRLSGREQVSRLQATSSRGCASVLRVGASAVENGPKGGAEVLPGPEGEKAGMCLKEEARLSEKLRVGRSPGLLAVSSMLMSLLCVSGKVSLNRLCID